MSDFESIDLSEIEGETEVSPPLLYAAQLIEWAADRHATDLFVSDDAKSVVIAIRRLGRIEEVRRLAREYGRRLQGHFRAIADAGAGDLVHPVEGRGTLPLGPRRSIDFRLSAIPTLFGQDVSIRLFDSEWSQVQLDQLGLNRDELSTIHRLLQFPSGLILVSGPVASGKTSTLYSALRYLNDGSRKIHTIEDPIEYPLPGVHQSQVNVRAKLDFADLLLALLRHSPDVIMIGEIRDPQIARTAVRAGASGQLVLATVHADSAAQAIGVMRQYDVNTTFLARTLIGVINQRLIRRLCPECRQEIAAGDELVGNDAVRQQLRGETPLLHRAVGCEACNGSGFSSLTCLPEIMLISPEIEMAIIEGASSSDLEALAADQGMLRMVDAAQVRVLRGITTPEEICREVDSPELSHLVARYRAAEVRDGDSNGRGES
jgi:type II secretory ATPase GspE/PulE/Tfp pilus assembly ATPase PilB-like protein